ncbi:MAG: LacI family DNA-binding transcriptional regulator [Thermomicrobiales bacterium]|nr:LacI family DNA-binding transcriptional regulator [Thermomicrobiales bacterium]
MGDRSKPNKRVTLQDVAQRAGVSTAAVSYVINGGPRPTSPELRARVLSAIAELDYHPNSAARGLRGRRTNTIAFVTYDFLPNESFSSHYLGRMLTALTRELQQHGNYLLMFPLATGDDPTPLRKMLKSERVDGIVARFVQDPPHTDALLEVVQESGTPCVCVERPGDARFGFPGITYDDDEGGALATNHLLGLGHRRIAHLAGDMRYATARRRMSSYQRTIVASGIPFDADISAVANWDIRQARGETHRMLSLPDPPTAIFAASDDMAFGALHAAHDRGLRVPEDLAVVGFDDIPLAHQLTPLLTTIRAPLDEMGVRAARLLTGHTKADPEALVETRPVQLIRRDSA